MFNLIILHEKHDKYINSQGKSLKLQKILVCRQCHGKVLENYGKDFNTVKSALCIKRKHVMYLKIKKIWNLIVMYCKCQGNYLHVSQHSNL